MRSWLESCRRVESREDELSPFPPAKEEDLLLRDKEIVEKGQLRGQEERIHQERGEEGERKNEPTSLPEE